MISIKQFALLFVLCLMPFAFLSLREYFIGADSYYFLNHVCNNNPTEWWSTSLLTPFILDFIPCNPAIINLILFTSLLLSTFWVAQTGNLINKKYGWMAGLFLFLSSKWMQGFLVFEDDPISYPLLFASLYFFIKGTMQDNWKDKVIALALVGLACLIWKGAILYFIVYGLTYIVSTIIAVPILLLKGKELLSNIIPSTVHAFENHAIIGILFTQVLALGLIAGIKLLPYVLLPMYFFWTIVLFFNAKFIVHALPLYALSVMILYSNLKEKMNDKPKWKPFTQSILLMLILLVPAIAIPSSYNVINQMPFPEQMQLIQKGIQLSQETGKPLKNEWSAGYWIEWFNGTPTQWGGYMGEQDYNNSIAIEWTELPCKKIMEARELKLYDC